VKKILLITYAFPPYATPESYLCSKLIGNLEGVSKDVLTLNFPIEGLNDLDPSLDEYVRVKFNKIFRVKVPKIINFLSKTGLKNLFRFPDYFKLANKYLINFINSELNLDEYTHIITWSQFHSVHLVGLDLKKKYNINWVTYFSDPWSDNPFQKSFLGLERYLNKKIENEVINNSDKIIYTSEETRKLVNQKYDFSVDTKSYSIPHCFDKNLYVFNRTIYDTKNSYPEDVFIFRYIGKFYGRRNPNTLSKAIKKIKKNRPEIFKKIVFEVYGQQNLYIKFKLFILKDLIKYFGPISYLSSLNLMKTSDCLLIIDAPFSNSVFFPSKLVDYMGANKFVLGITPLKGTASDIIKEMGGIVVDPNNIEAIYNSIIKIYNNLNKKKGSKNNESYLNIHSSVDVSKKLYKILF
tara:strand:+ start:4003 stop:5226 length:1224 start_codon:yes stop_codon:yes gene_type:complete